MWICVNCGERDNRTPGRCRRCERPGRHARAPEPPASRWIPRHADPGPPEEQIRNRLLPGLPIAVLVAALITAAVIGGPRLFGRERQPRTAPAAAITDEAIPVPVPVPSSTTPILENSATALVSIDPDVDDPRADQVAALFEAFFTAINERDHQAVAGVLDPAGELNPGVPGQMAAFAEGTATTRDSDVVLRGLTTAASGKLRAEVTFRSEQEAGHGPPERPDETCTRWQVLYLLSTDHQGRYRVFQSDAVTEPC